jgi:predicted nucleotide-binding protein
MTADELLDVLRPYEAELTGVIRRFTHKPGSIDIEREDDDRFRQMAGELIDLFNDTLPRLRYAPQLAHELQQGTLYHSPSLHCVQEFARIVRQAIIRIERSPDMVTRAATQTTRRTESDPKKVFIIHGHDEAKRRELEAMLSTQFGLVPIVLVDQPNAGANTIIEKFEHYAPKCSFAFALFTPDDQVTIGGSPYLQARPNVIWELGWFCAELGRTNVMLILKDGTEVFSDFSGIIQHRFKTNVTERFVEIQRDLRGAKLIT